MGWNPTVRDIGDFANEDRRWIKTLLGYDQCRSVTLDASAFTADHLTAKGAIPSGTVLARITATDKYGPWNGAVAGANESVSLDDTGTVSGGTFTITFDGETTAAIAYNATAATIKTALEGLSNIDPGDVETSGGPLVTAPVVIAFGGQYAGENVPNLIVDNTSITGGGTIDATVTAGGAGSGLETPAGFLFTAVNLVSGVLALDDPTTAPDPVATLYWGPGIIDRNYLPHFENTDAGEYGDAVDAAFPNIRFEGTYA